MPAQKQYWIGPPFKHKNGDFGANRTGSGHALVQCEQVPGR